MHILYGAIEVSEQSCPANIDKAGENSVEHKKVTDFHD